MQAGMVFSRLTVVRAEIVNGRTLWRCRCRCGNEKLALATELRQGKIKSCGCLYREIARTRRRTHGRSKTPEYVAWRGMLARCHNPNDPSYGDYGARGITVCLRWRTDFAAFLSDMGMRPTSGHSVERKNNDEGYGPENCIWATRIEQNRNSRHNHLVRVGEENIPLSVACERAGLEYHMVKKRLRRGWPIDLALSAPPGSRMVA